MNEAAQSVPVVIGEIHYNRCSRAPYHDPFEWTIQRLVDFHVRQPGRDVNEAALTRDRAEFATFSPPHVTLALEHVCDGFLLAVMMNGGFRTRLDGKESAP